MEYIVRGGGREVAGQPILSMTSLLFISNTCAAAEISKSALKIRISNIESRTSNSTINIFEVSRLQLRVSGFFISIGFQI